MGKRSDRQEAVRSIVREGSVRTQKDLADRLNALGFQCTQATISRDVAEMGLRKAPDGSYVLQEDLKLIQMVRDMVTGVDRAENLVVIKVSAGAASGVGVALDDAELEGVVGTIAGDDTILVVVRDSERAKVLVTVVENMMV